MKVIHLKQSKLNTNRYPCRNITQEHDKDPIDVGSIVVFGNELETGPKHITPPSTKHEETE